MSPSGGKEPKRWLTYIVVAMALGFVFLLLACGLIGWNYAVAPVPKGLAFGAVALGALSATVILAAVVLYSLAARRQP